MPALFNLQFFGNFLYVIINAIFSILIIRFLSIDDYGVYGFLASFLAFSLFLTNFGFSGVIQKRIPNSTYPQKSGIFYLFTGIKTIAQLIFVLITAVYLVYFRNFDFLLIACFSIFLFLGNINNFILGVFFIINLQQKSSFLNLITISLFKLTTLFLFYYFFEINIFYIFVLLAAAELLSFFISFFSWPKWKLIEIPKTSIILEAKPFFLTKIIELLFLPAIAIFFLSYFHDFSEVSKFKAITTIALMVIANSSLLSRFEFLLINIEKGELLDSLKIKTFKKMITTVFVVFSIIILSTMVIFSELIDEVIFAGKYKSASFYLPVVSACIILNHLSYLFSPHIYKFNKESIFPKATLFSATVYLICCFSFIPSYSYEGAIAALCLGYLVKPMFFSVLYKEQINFIFQKKICLTFGICLAFMVSIFAITTSSDFSILVDIAIFLVGVILMIFTLHFFVLKKYFFHDFMDTFRRIKLNE